MVVYQINAPLWYKRTCRESESRNFDCQWTLVSFRVKQHLFYQEATLTCPLYRLTEDICIGICVFKSVFNVWQVLKKLSMQQQFEQFVGKQRRVELQSVWNFEARTVLVEREFSFHWKSCVGHSTDWNIFRSHIVHETVLKNQKVKKQSRAISPISWLALFMSNANLHQ